MNKIKVSALGGIGEYGKYLFIVEINGSIFILDAGLKNPELDFYGIDAVIPDLTYLIENKERIEGIFISHGHQENIGALPYLLRKIKARVYGSHFTISIIESLLKTNEMNIEEYKLYRINEGKTLTFKNNVIVSFFNTSHSIPESVGIAIHVPDDGIIVYTSDFNFNPSNNKKYETSFHKITELTNKGSVLMVLAESLGIIDVDRVTNNIIYEHRLHSIISSAKERLFASLYSTDLSRIQMLIDIALRYNKRIAFVYRKQERLMNVAINTKYLDVPVDKLVTINEHNAKDKDLLIIIAGTRFETYNIIQKMLDKKDPNITLEEGDEVIIVSKPVIGTEVVASKTLDDLYRHDISVHMIDDKLLRTSHATTEDLMTLYNILKPKYVLPIIGEYRHQYRHAELLRQIGFKEGQIITIDNGLSACFKDGTFIGTEEIPSGDVLLDGSLVGSVDETIMQERESLALGGTFIVVTHVNISEQIIVKEPFILTKGYVASANTEKAKTAIVEMTTKMINNALKRKVTAGKELVASLQNEIGKIIYRFDRTAPIVVPVIVEITK